MVINKWPKQAVACLPEAANSNKVMVASSLRQRTASGAIAFDSSNWLFEPARRTPPESRIRKGSQGLHPIKNPPTHGWAAGLVK
jgi:hypothetical protein